MDRASFNIYKTSLLREDKAHAVCCATLNTTLVCGGLEALRVEYSIDSIGLGTWCHAVRWTSFRAITSSIHNPQAVQVLNCN